MDEEQAKAAGEIAKAFGKTVDQIDKLDDIGSRLLGPVGQLYAWLTDAVREGRLRWVAEQRIKNYATIIDLAEHRRVALNLPEAAKPIPIDSRFGEQYRDGMEQEDEPALQELWANLLVNTTRADGDRADPQRSFGSLLREMDPDDAALFNVFARRPEISRFYLIPEHLESEEAATTFRYDLEPLQDGPSDLSDGFATFEDPMRIRLKAWPRQRTLEAVDRLRRLALIEYAADRTGVVRRLFENAISDKPSGIATGQFARSLEDLFSKYRISPLGRAFYRAIREPVIAAKLKE